MMKARKLRAEEVSFTVECIAEETPVHGNAMASGDPAADREVEDWIRRELDTGNLWAWCTVRVTAHWRGLQGVDHLGCCSYRNEAEFRAPGGYFEDMKDRALDDLNRRIAESVRTLEPIILREVES